MARFFAFVTLFHLSLTFFRPEVPFKPGLGYDYIIRFIGCDSIQTCSFVSEGFESHTMIYREFKRIDQTIAPSETSLKATITRCDLSSRFFCIDATLLCEFESDKI